MALAKEVVTCDVTTSDPYAGIEAVLPLSLELGVDWAWHRGAAGIMANIRNRARWHRGHLCCPGALRCLVHRTVSDPHVPAGGRGV